MSEVALELLDGTHVLDVWFPIAEPVTQTGSVLDSAAESGLAASSSQGASAPVSGTGGRTNGSGPSDHVRPEDQFRSLVAQVRHDAGISQTPITALLNVRTNEVISVDTAPRSMDLLQGDQLVVGELPPRDGFGNGTAPIPTKVFLELLNGPQAGLFVALSEGEHGIGRSESNTLAINHDSVSRNHARLSFSRTVGWSIVDGDSANETTVGGTRIGREPVSIAFGAVIGVGDIVVAFHDEGRLPAHLQRSERHLLFNRPPRVQPSDPRQTYTYPKTPQKPTKRNIPIVTLIVPLIVAGAMAVLISPTYLLLGLASPALMLGSLFEDRRTGRRTLREETLQWRDQCAELHEQLRRAHELAFFARVARNPSAAVAAARIVARTSDVWQVRPAQTDFLQTAIGISNLASVLTVNIPEQGDSDLRAEVVAVAEQVNIDRNVPVVLDLIKLGTVGIVGTQHDRALVVNAQLLQLVGAHTPQDLQLVLLSPMTPDTWDWCKWLPHCLLDGETAIATNEGQADRYFHALLDLAEARVEARSGSIGSPNLLPHMVVVIEPPIPIAPRDAARLCELAKEASISVVWLADEVEQLPGASRAIVRCRDSNVNQTRGAMLGSTTGQIGPGGTGGTTHGFTNGSAATPGATKLTATTLMVGSVVYPETGERIEEIKLDICTEATARRTARALSPWRNTNSADNRGGIPTKVDLFDLLDPQPSDARAIVSTWNASGFGVNAVLGRGFRGSISVDMRADGPHALVAGTTGAGKSELLQAWVGALAAQHPPTRVTFVLIDYKGGAAFKDCVQLPHTVGFVTDLDPQAGHRAMVSLNAEITHREHVLARFGAKDLMELEARYPQEAPPVLVIIVDEFAALKSELPDFVSGLIDIAQRGRSLGIHLILATQKPGGVVDPKIQANTNLRIALRMANSNESQDVLGRPLAASISRRTPGRSYVRIGENQLFEMQAAYVGGWAKTADLVAVRSEPRLFALGVSAGSTVTGGSPRNARTELQVLVAACYEANMVLGLAPARKPWMDPLPAALSTQSLQEVADLDAKRTVQPGLAVAIGLADEPSTQRQYPFMLDLAAEGNVAIYGGPGVGKTTVLRTLALQLADRFGPKRLHLYGLDFASRGLMPLEKLPHCGGIVTGDQLDRVRRVIDMASSELLARQEQLAEVGAGTLAELEKATGAIVPSFVLLIDGFGSFWQTVEPLDRSEHVNKLLRIAADGRGVGIHLVYTADRRSAVVPALSSVTGGRYVMNIPSPEEYASLGFPHLSRTGAVLVPGRLVIRDGLEVQTALVSDSGDDGVAQSQAITKRAEELVRRYPDAAVPPVRDLPQRIDRSEFSSVLSTPNNALFAIDDQRRSPVSVDFTWNPLFFLVGPDQSGRSTALRTLARELLRSTPQLSAHFVSVRRNALGDESWWNSAAVGTAAIERISELRTLVDDRIRDPQLCVEPLLIVVDDGDELTEGLPTPHLEAIVKSARDANVFVIAAMSTFRATRAFCVWVPFMRSNRHGILLQPGEDEGEIFNARLPKRTGLQLPPGRGYLFQRGTPRLVQILLDESH
jgi:DNA segregation ATPase FtsK/SpoIIIE, S-DNA-T family